MDGFIEKLQADQERLQDHLRGQALRFQKLGETLSEVQNNGGRIFVIGESVLEELSRIIALEFLKGFNVVPVSLQNPDTEDLSEVSGDYNLRLPNSVPPKVQEFAQHFRANDAVLAFLHEGSSRPIRKALKIATKRKVTVLAIGGLGARESLRSLADVFLPLPTRGIKTICEASFVCARIMARFARAEQVESEANEKDQVISTWSNLKKVGEKTAREARKNVRESSDNTQRTKKRTKTTRTKRRRKTNSADLSGSTERENSKKSSRKRRKTNSSDNTRDDSGTTKRRKTNSGRADSGQHKRKRRGSGTIERDGARSSTRLKRDESGRKRRKDKSRRLSKTSARQAPVNDSPVEVLEPLVNTTESAHEKDLTQSPGSEPMTIKIDPSDEKLSGPAVSGEVVTPEWLEHNNSAQQPIGVGSSFRSSGIFGELGLDSDELMPRYIREALDPNALPLPAPDLDSFKQPASDRQSRFVSARFQVQQCTLRFAVGAYPDDQVPEHSLLQLSSKQTAFLLDGTDDAAATLGPGDELWLRIEVPAFLEPILARAVIVGFETSEESDGLRINLQFTALDPEHQRKIKIAAETVASRTN